MDSKYIRNILNLKYISPELTEQIFNGTQPKKFKFAKINNKILLKKLKFN